MPALRHALEREIKRLVIRGVTHDGEDVELTAAVRKGLQLYLDVELRRLCKMTHERIQLLGVSHDVDVRHDRAVHATEPDQRRWLLSVR